MSKKSSVTAAITNIVKKPSTKKGRRAIVELPLPTPTPMSAPAPRIDTAKIEVPKDPGATKIVDKLSPADLKREINDLLDELRNCTVKNEKKAIRRKLRARGHRGGLGGVKTATTATTKAAVSSDDDDEDDDD